MTYASVNLRSFQIYGIAQPYENESRFYAARKVYVPDKTLRKRLLDTSMMVFSELLYILRA